MNKIKQIAQSTTWYLLCYLCRLLAKGLLIITGWTLPDTMPKESKILYIYSSSSYWDSIIFGLICIAKPELYQDVYILSQPWGGKFKSLFKSFRFITSNSYETHDFGSVNNIIDQLVSKERFKLMMPNEIGRNNDYYWIANGLACKLAAIGLDYEKKEMIVGDVYAHDDEDLVTQLKSDLEKLVPLYPTRELANVSVVDYLLFSLFCSTFWTIFNLGTYSYWLLALGLISALPSLKYHMEQESSPLLSRIKLYLHSFSLSVYVLHLLWYQKVPINPVWYGLILLTGLLYYVTSGRCQPRTKKYIYLHSCFHLLSGYVLMWPIAY